MTTDFEELLGRLSDHERILAETIGDLSAIENDLSVGMNMEAFARSGLEQLPGSDAENSARESVRLERALSQLLEVGQSGSSENGHSPSGSRVFTSEELARVNPRTASSDLRRDENDHLIRESNDLLKGIDVKLDSLTEAKREQFF